MPKNKKKGLSTLTKGIVGAVVGAGIAVAAKKVLSNKKIKKGISENYSKAKDFVKKEVADYGQDLAKTTKSKVKKVKTAIKKKI